MTLYCLTYRLRNMLVNGTDTHTHRFATPLEREIVAISLAPYADVVREWEEEQVAAPEAKAS